MTTLVTASLVLVTLAPLLEGCNQMSDDPSVNRLRLVEMLRRLADIIEDEDEVTTQRPQKQTKTFVTPRPSISTTATTATSARCVFKIIY